MKNTVPVKIKLIHPQASVPAYHSAEAAGADLAVVEEIVFAPGEVRAVPLGIALDIPLGYWLMIAARSSLYKRGLKLANGVGVGDSDYRGENDQYHLLLHNFTSQSVTLAQGERVAQGILLPRLEMQFETVAHLHAPDRGGFGSTGQ